MAKIDPKAFNTDPKHEAEREEFDALIEGSVSRIKAKHDKNNPPAPPKEKGFLDSFLDGILGGSEEKK